jgi:site-specific DNA recombinase
MFQPPVGYASGPEGGPSLVHDDGIAELVARAFEEFASGKYQQRELLTRLSRRGLRTRRGRSMCLQSLRSLLRNRLYAGWVEVQKWDISVRGDFEPIVSEAVFNRVQALLSARGRVSRRHALDNPDYPLRRFVKCGRCGKPLTGSRSKGHSRQYRYYHCICGGVRARKEDFEDAFRQLLTRLQPCPEYLRLFNAVVLDVWNEGKAEARRVRARLERRVAELRQREDRLEEAFIHRREIDRHTYERQRDRLREQIAQAEGELGEAAGEGLDAEGLLAYAQHVLTNAAGLWERASLDQKQRLQGVFFPKGLVFDGSGFGTPVTCLAFSELPSPHDAKDAVASPTGFEPVSPP